MFRITLDVMRYSVPDTIRFTIMTEKDFTLYPGTSKDNCIALDSKLFAYHGCLTRMHQVQIAGLNLKCIDFAVPLSFQKENLKRFKNGDWAIWNYSQNNWGEPIWNSELDRVVLRELNDKVADVISKQFSSYRKYSTQLYSDAI